MRFLFLSILIFTTAALQAQNLSGIWSGKRTATEGCSHEYALELQINFSNNVIIGRSYSYLDKDRFTKINFTGRYNPDTKRMVIIESAVLQYNVPYNCVPCIKTYDLTWIKNGNEEALTGDWKGHEMGNTTACYPGGIYLTRQTKSVFPTEVFQNDSLVLLQKNMKIVSREKQLVQSIAVDTSHIKIELYDNAEIDDDTVSVFLNNALLLHKKRLTDKALILYFDAFPNTDYELMMYAENLGKIPPNTSLMVITAGKKRYEMRISANEQKNAVVKFRYIQ